MKLTPKPLAYARRNGGRDKGDVGGQLRENVEEMSERMYRYEMEGEERSHRFSSVGSTKTHTDK